MTVYFPITEPINNDADFIITALNQRSEQLNEAIDSQSFLKKITLFATKTIMIAAMIIAAASTPAAAMTLSSTPLICGGITLAIAISCLVINIILGPKNPHELNIRDLWGSVFSALKDGSGRLILESLEELVKQKTQRLNTFKQALLGCKANETIPFFHKTWVVAYLQIALDYLRQNEKEEARSNAHLALSHFTTSGFASVVKKFIQEIAESPDDMKFYIEQNKEAGMDLHALDYLIILKRSEQPVAGKNG